jgi:hypothetical protein
MTEIFPTPARPSRSVDGAWMTMAIVAGGVVPGFAAPTHRFDVPDGATR